MRLRLYKLGLKCNATWLSLPLFYDSLFSEVPPCLPGTPAVWVMAKGMPQAWAVRLARPPGWVADGI